MNSDYIRSAESFYRRRLLRVGVLIGTILSAALSFAYAGILFDLHSFVLGGIWIAVATIYLMLGFIVLYAHRTFSSPRLEKYHPWHLTYLIYTCAMALLFLFQLAITHFRNAAVLYQSEVCSTVGELVEINGHSISCGHLRIDSIFSYIVVGACVLCLISNIVLCYKLSTADTHDWDFVMLTAMNKTLTGSKGSVLTVDEGDWTA